MRRVYSHEPVAALYFVAAALLGRPHSLATVYGKALGNVLPGQTVTVDNLTSAAVALGAGTQATDPATGKTAVSLGLQTAQPMRPDAWVDRWDMQRPHPATSLAVEACRTIAEAGLSSATVIVQMLE